MPIIVKGNLTIQGNHIEKVDTLYDHCTFNTPSPQPHPATKHAQQAELVEDVVPVTTTPQPSEEPLVEPTITKHEPRRPGPKTKHLFLNKDGEKDEQRTLQEAQRVKKYLSTHHLGNKKIDSSTDTKINIVVANFWLYWNDRNLVDKKFSGTALHRFLTEDCGLECNVVKNAFTGTIQGLIDSGPDSEIFDSIAEFYEIINKNK